MLNSVGIIGGADGPTAIFVAASGLPVLFAVIAAAVAATACIVIIKKRKQ